MPYQRKIKKKGKMKLTQNLNFFFWMVKANEDIESSMYTQYNG